MASMYYDPGEYLQMIDELLEDTNYAKVSQLLEGIKITINKTNRVTDKQAETIDNIYYSYYKNN